MLARRQILTAIMLLFATALGHSAILAQTAPPITQGAQGVKRTILQKMDVPGTNLETIICE